MSACLFPHIQRIWMWKCMQYGYVRLAQANFCFDKQNIMEKVIHSKTEFLPHVGYYMHGLHSSRIHWKERWLLSWRLVLYLSDRNQFNFVTWVISHCWLYTAHSLETIVATSYILSHCLWGMDSWENYFPRYLHDEVFTNGLFFMRIALLLCSWSSQGQCIKQSWYGTTQDF